MTIVNNDLRAMEKAYDDACWADAAHVERVTVYGAGHWKRAMRAHGAYEAAVQLIRRGRGQPQEGYMHMIELDFLYPDQGIRERTVEYSVLRPEWRPIFERVPDVMDFARVILRRSDIPLP